MKNQLLRIQVVFPILLFAVCAPQILAGQSPSVIKIGSWNVEWFYDADQSDNRSDLAKEKSAPSKADWQWKLDSVVKVVAKHQPYVMAFQEIENRKVLFDIRNQLRKDHQLSYRVAFVEGFDTFTEQDVGIIFRNDLVEMSRKEQNQIQWKSRKYSNLSKHLFAKFEFTAGDQTESLTILNVHLRASPDKEAARIKQILLVREWIDEMAAKGENVIVLGDFNTEHAFGKQTKQSDIGILRGLNDSRSENDLWDTHESIPARFRSTHMTGKQFDRILFSRALKSDEANRKDLVFKSGYTAKNDVVVGKTDVGDQRWNNVFDIPLKERDISDHYPVFANFEIK